MGDLGGGYRIQCLVSVGALAALLRLLLLLLCLAELAILRCRRFLRRTRGSLLGSLLALGDCSSVCGFARLILVAGWLSLAGAC